MGIHPGGYNPYNKGGYIPAGWAPSPGVPQPTSPAVPDPYGGETVTLVPGRLRGYRTWQIVWPHGAISGRTPEGDDGYERYQYPPPDVHLAGITATTRWLPGDLPAAECTRQHLVEMSKYALREGEDPEHPAGAPVPAKGCSCGYYALHNPRTFHRTGRPAGPCVCPSCVWVGWGLPKVMGVVDGWGRVEIGPDGWRARHARIVALHVPRPEPRQVTEKVFKPSKPSSLWPWMLPSDLIGTRVVERMCGQAVAAYYELGHALSCKYQVPIFGDWEDVIKAFPPTDLEALRGRRGEGSTS